MKLRLPILLLQGLVARADDVKRTTEIPALTFLGIALISGCPFPQPTRLNDRSRDLASIRKYKSLERINANRNLCRSPGWLPHRGSIWFNLVSQTHHQSVRRKCLSRTRVLTMW
jgi:hypothetical protein